MTMRIGDFVVFEMNKSGNAPRWVYQDKDNWEDKGGSEVFQRARVVDQNQFGFTVPYFDSAGREFVWMWPANSYEIAEVDGFDGFLRKVGTR